MYNSLESGIRMTSRASGVYVRVGEVGEDVDMSATFWSYAPQPVVPVAFISLQSALPCNLFV